MLCHVEFKLYAATGVDSMMSMASTYFGRDVNSNKMWVRKEIDQVGSLNAYLAPPTVPLND